MSNNEIFSILEKDAKLTPEQIAAMTGSSAAEVSQVIKQAEKDRAIVKYKTLINWDKVGNEHVWALVEVKITPQREVGFDAIAERIYKFDEARTVYLMSGTYDLAVIVTGRTMQEVAEFVTRKIAPIEGVTGTVSHFVLRRYKEDGEIFDSKEEGKRQAVIL
ncbi:MAG: Lrp/AsnC family transcriptional regulator [Dehalococcoidia bacterium]|nr:Lrp/AsnC family transcriptional regulator [Dehalococcoidia bacterium]